jgi:hypothetical protein
LTHERRRAARHCTSANFLVIHRDTNELVGRVLDMSTSGLLLASESAISVDVTLYCQLKFPYWHGLHQHVNCQATSRWCQKNLHLDWYESGWILHGLSDVDQKVVEELIDEWDIKDNLGSFRANISE